MLTDPKPQRRREEPWGLSENLHVGVQRSAENPAFSEQPKPLTDEERDILETWAHPNAGNGEIARFATRLLAEHDALKEKCRETEAESRLKDINGDCIMMLRDQLKRLFGVEAAFFDDVVLLACHKAWQLGTAGESLPEPEIEQGASDGD